jgi:predicted DCC family thiol-disulfide oxidoreductase YuxK
MQPTAPTSDHPVLLFDGHCTLCSRSVQMVLRHDHRGQFRFASLQSEAGQHLLAQAQLPPDSLDTAVLVESGRISLRSDAGLRIAARLGGWWRLTQVFWLVPRGIRNAVYDWVARNRYRWFGREEQCWLPRPEWRERFLS